MEEPVPLLSYFLAEGCDENDPRLFVGVVRGEILDDGPACGAPLAMALELHRLFDAEHVKGKYHEWLARMDSSIDWLEWIRNGMMGWNEARAKGRMNGTLEALLTCRKHWLREEALARQAMVRALDRATHAIANIDAVDRIIQTRDP